MWSGPEILVPPCGAWWGAYVPYDSDGSLKDAVHAFERKIGRRLDLLYMYHDMSNSELDGQLLTPDEQILGRDRMLMLAWESTVWREPHHANWTEDQLGWAKVASGAYDREIIDPQARRIKAYGKRVFFSFDQEADARVGDAGTPEEYVAAYRHIHERFEELGVDNVVWVWTVSGYLGSGEPFERLYPGDDHVDWIGMDQYNYYTCHRTTDWKDFDRSQRPAYDWPRTHISAEKPLMFAEFSTVPDPADADRPDAEEQRRGVQGRHRHQKRRPGRRGPGAVRRDGGAVHDDHEHPGGQGDRGQRGDELLAGQPVAAGPRDL